MSDTLAPPSPAPLAAAGVFKRFGAVAALHDASVTLRAGEVSAIVGENGAGKSTLARIAAGLLAADAGAVLVDGRARTPWTRREALGAGIGFVPQTLSFVSTLSVVENHLLGGRGWRLDRRAARAALTRAGEEIGVSVPLDRPVEGLSLGERQLGEIVSAVAAGARTLLLDEPTSALGPAEIAKLIATLRRLAASGTTIGLVTHRVAEVLEGADHITVLRAGRVVMDARTEGLDAEAVARLMVGERDRKAPRRALSASIWERLGVRGLSVSENGVAVLRDVSFSVRQGEVLGVAGVSGAMQPALAQCLAGLRVPQRGSVVLDGEDITGNPGRAARKGLGYVPEERGEGIAPELTNAENASLFRLGADGFTRFGLRDRAAERRLGAQVITAFGVRPPDPGLASGGLSGGNAQKLLVGRELEREPGAIVAHGPTQGLDLAAAASIRAALGDAAAKGAAVVVISADLDELMETAHRMVVLAGGRIAAEFALDRPVDAAALGRAMTEGADDETGGLAA